jgi:hypothetical protein
LKTSGGGGERRTGTTSPVVLLLVSLALLGAGHDEPDATPSAPTPDFRTIIAERLPRVGHRGGPFLRRPRIVTITFAGDDAELVARLERFGDTITRTDWWRTVTDGYCTRPGDCVGEGRPGSALRLDDILPADLHAAELSDLLVRHARSGRLGLLDDDTLLLVYLPASVRLRDAFVPRYCERGRRAVHRALRFDGKAVGYAVMPRCSTESELTATASHEVLEVVTNPDPARRGFAFEQTSATLGFTAAGIEPVDPCGIITQDTHRAVESGFVVQRAWSNRMAESGREPCVPVVPQRPYVALVPERPTVRLAKVGDHVTIPLQAMADGPVSAWTVSAVDLTGRQEQTRYVDVALDRTTVTPGAPATLTISVLQLHPREVVLVGLVSTLDDVSHLWPVAVSMR